MHKNLTVSFTSAGPENLTEDDDIKISTISSREWIVVDAGGAKIPMKISDLQKAIDEINLFNRTKEEQSLIDSAMRCNCRDCDGTT